MEILLLTGCLFGNSNSCITSVQSYYLTTSLPAYINTLEKEHKQAVMAITLMGTMFERKASIGIGYNLVATMDFTTGVGSPYLKWSWGF